MIDNKEATIQVGQDVPVVTAEVTAADTATSTSSSVTRSVQYRSTGVMLTVKPTINTEGLVTLTISQEVSNPGADGAGGSPIIQTRKINTTVVVGHGQTLALGGLMQETDSLSEAKVPLLGDLPLIGNVFKYTSKTKEKTELLVLVTPTILTNTDEGGPDNRRTEKRTEVAEIVRRFSQKTQIFLDLTDIFCRLVPLGVRALVARHACRRPMRWEAASFQSRCTTVICKDRGIMIRCAGSP